MRLHTRITSTPTCRTLHVTGEVDLVTADELRSALHALRESAEPVVEVDLSEVTFMDSTGLGVLVATHRTFAEHGVALSIHAPTRRLRQLFAMTALDTILTVTEAPHTHTSPAR